MSTYQLIEASVIAAAVAISAWVAFGAVMPKLRAHLLGRLRGVSPAELAKKDCDSGCGSCGSCGTSSPKRHEQPVHFQPKR